MPPAGKVHHILSPQHPEQGNLLLAAPAPIMEVLPKGLVLHSQGLPIGLQIGGRPFEEETVLKVGHAYEQSTPWHTIRPPNT